MKYHFDLRLVNKKGYKNGRFIGKKSLLSQLLIRVIGSLLTQFAANLKFVALNKKLIYHGFNLISVSVASGPSSDFAKREGVIRGFLVQRSKPTA